MGKVFDKLVTEIKDKRLYLMAEYFDSFEKPEAFLREVDDLTRNIGGSDQGGYLYCHFPQVLDEYELAIGDGFDGIEFSLFEDKISVDVPTFRKYLRIACEAYWKMHPESRAQLEEYLTRPQPPLEDGALPEWRERRDAGEYPKPLSEFE